MHEVSLARIGQDKSLRAACCYWLGNKESSHDMCGDGFAASHRVYTFIGFGFEMNFFDGELKRFCQHFSHLGKMRPQLRPFRESPQHRYVRSQISFRRAILRACSRNKRLFAPFHLGSLSGKCVPMSPSPAAPSSASTIAWATTSPSEWPTGTFIEGNLHPSNDQLASFGQPMKIVSNPAAHAHAFFCSDCR